MCDVRSFVVRVYRRESRGWAGVVETVATGEVHPLRFAVELRALRARRRDATAASGLGMPTGNACARAGRAAARFETSRP